CRDDKGVTALHDHAIVDQPERCRTSEGAGAAGGIDDLYTLCVDDLLSWNGADEQRGGSSDGAGDHKFIRAKLSVGHADVDAEACIAAGDVIAGDIEDVARKPIAHIDDAAGILECFQVRERGRSAD